MFSDNILSNTDLKKLKDTHLQKVMKIKNSYPDYLQQIYIDLENQSYKQKLRYIF